MIRKSIVATQAATFCVELPNSRNHGMPTPTGTGFFISPEGWFVTAAHVITENNRPDGPVRKDLNQACLMKEIRSVMGGLLGMCQAVSFGYILPSFDFAMLKVDFPANSSKEWLKGKTEFPYLRVSKRQLEEGEPVYAFGYPLPDSWAISATGITIGSNVLRPRTTSAIVASTIYESGMVVTDADPKVYVLDKALNFGNSGGPIISSETGQAHALCSRFQPVAVPQNIKDSKGNPVFVQVPSLYGVVSSLGNKPIIELLEKLNVPLSEN